jgi:hypothetical protein
MKLLATAYEPCPVQEVFLFLFPTSIFQRIYKLECNAYDAMNPSNIIDGWRWEFGPRASDPMKRIGILDIK